MSRCQQPVHGDAGKALVEPYAVDLQADAREVSEQ
jgi:hypothetical protein